MHNDRGLDYLVYYSTIGTHLLGTSLISCILTLFTLSATGGRCKLFYEPYLRWWYYTRLVFAWTIGTLTYGGYCCFQVFNYIMAFKFPDRYIEDHPGADITYWNGEYSSYGFISIIGALLSGVANITVLVILGIANSAMFMKALNIDTRVAPRSSTAFAGRSRSAVQG